MAFPETLIRKLSAPDCTGHTRRRVGSVMTAASALNPCTMVVRVPTPPTLLADDAFHQNVAGRLVTKSLQRLDREDVGRNPGFHVARATSIHLPIANGAAPGRL